MKDKNVTEVLQYTLHHRMTVTKTFNKYGKNKWNEYLDL